MGHGNTHLAGSMTAFALAADVRAVVMIPTYNEVANLPALIEQLLALPDGFGAVVVDDDSPDGTGRLALELARQHPGRIDVVNRTERGRGTAGIAGFVRALALDAPYILEMDADLSHDPADLPRLLQACQAGADVAIGSRYVAGGGQSDRSAYRALVSIASNVVYRAVLGVAVKDISSGYKCYSRRALAALNWAAFLSTGYAIGMETVFRLHRHGFRLVEVPIRFTDRRAGQSKFRPREAAQCLAVCVRLAASLGRG